MASVSEEEFISINEEAVLPEGVLQISGDGDDRRIFSGLKFFWVGKFGKYFFVWSDLSTDFFG